MNISHKHLRWDAVNNTLKFGPSWLGILPQVFQLWSEKMSPFPVCIHTYRHITDVTNKDDSTDRMYYSLYWVMFGGKMVLGIGVRNRVLSITGTYHIVLRLHRYPNFLTVKLRAILPHQCIISLRAASKCRYAHLFSNSIPQQIKIYTFFMRKMVAWVNILDPAYLPLLSLE